MSYYDDYYSDYYYVDDIFRGAERDSVFKIESSFRSLYLSMPRSAAVPYFDCKFEFRIGSYGYFDAE